MAGRVRVSIDTHENCIVLTPSLLKDVNDLCTSLVSSGELPNIDKVTETLRRVYILEYLLQFYHTYNERLNQLTQKLSQSHIDVTIKTEPFGNEEEQNMDSPDEEGNDNDDNGGFPEESANVATPHFSTNQSQKVGMSARVSSPHTGGFRRSSANPEMPEFQPKRQKPDEKLRESHTMNKREKTVISLLKSNAKEGNQILSIHPNSKASKGCTIKKIKGKGKRIRKQLELEEEAQNIVKNLDLKLIAEIKSFQVLQSDDTQSSPKDTDTTDFVQNNSGESLMNVQLSEIPIEPVQSTCEKDSEDDTIQSEKPKQAGRANKPLNVSQTLPDAKDVSSSKAAKQRASRQKQRRETETLMKQIEHSQALSAAKRDPLLPPFSTDSPEHRVPHLRQIQQLHHMRKLVKRGWKPSAEMRACLPDLKSLVDISKFCLTCGKCFVTDHGLKDHQASMHGENVRFSCSVCQKGFYEKKHFENHLESHQGIRNYSCQWCEKKFRSASNLKYHLNNCKSKLGIVEDPAKRPFACLICDARLANKKYLKDHVRACHEESKEYKCPCGKQYPWKSSLFKHKRKCQGYKDSKIGAREIMFA